MTVLQGKDLYDKKSATCRQSYRCTRFPTHSMIPHSSRFWSPRMVSEGANVIRKIEVPALEFCMADSSKNKTQLCGEEDRGGGVIVVLVESRAIRGS